MDIIKYMWREYYSQVEDDGIALYISSSRLNAKDFCLGHYDSRDFCGDFGLRDIAKIVDGDFASAQKVNMCFPGYYMCGFSLFEEVDGNYFCVEDYQLSDSVVSIFCNIIDDMRSCHCKEMDDSETSEFLSHVRNFNVNKQFHSGFKAFSYISNGSKRVVLIPWIKD